MNTLTNGGGASTSGERVAIGRMPITFGAAGAALYVVVDWLDTFGVLPNLYTLEDDTARLEALDDYATAFAVENVLSAVGLVIAALALWRFGLALRSAVDDRRLRLQAGLVAWAGLATGMWAIEPVTRLASTPEAIVDGLTNAPAQVVASGLICLVGTVTAFVSLGLVLLRLRHQRWLAWLLFVGALVGGAAFLVIGPALTAMVLLVATVTLSIAPPRVPVRSS